MVYELNIERYVNENAGPQRKVDCEIPRTISHKGVETFKTMRLTTIRKGPRLELLQMISKSDTRQCKG